MGRYVGSKTEYVKMQSLQGIQVVLVEEEVSLRAAEKQDTFQEHRGAEMDGSETISRGAGHGRDKKHPRSLEPI